MDYSLLVGVHDFEKTTTEERDKDTPEVDEENGVDDDDDSGVSFQIYLLDVLWCPILITFGHCFVL